MTIVWLIKELILIKIRKEIESFASDRLETNSKVPSLKITQEWQNKIPLCKTIEFLFLF